MVDEEEYEDLRSVISMNGFNYLKYYIEEDTVLRPRLEEANFYGIVFSAGETDSFGPLTRIVTAVDSGGNRRKFVYG